jgi:hypothetical protein
LDGWLNGIIVLSELYLFFVSLFISLRTPYRSLDSVRSELLQQLQGLQGAPSVQMQEVPPPFDLQKEKAAEGQNDGGAGDDVRSDRGQTKDGGDRKVHEAEFYDATD